MCTNDLNKTKSEKLNGYHHHDLQSKTHGLEMINIINDC